MEKKSDNKNSINGMHYGAEAFGFKNAETLRKYQTQAEYLLWEELKNKKLAGIKFRRQHPIGRFVVDFYCHTAKLVVELDGGIHENIEVKENDINRQHELEDFGLLVIRFSNEEIYLDIKKVLNKILDTIEMQHKLFEETDQKQRD